MWDIVWVSPQGHRPSINYSNTQEIFEKSTFCKRNLLQPSLLLSRRALASDCMRNANKSPKIPHSAIAVEEEM